MEAVVVVGRGIQERGRTGKAGVVDDHVDAAETKARRPEGGSDRAFVGDVHLNREYAVGVREGRSLALGGCGIDVREDDGRAKLVQFSCDREADS